jgi:hypothetical protein
MKKLIFLIFVFLIPCNSMALAFTQNDVRSIVGKTPYYNPDASGEKCDFNIDLLGSDNIQKGFNFFVGKGLSPVQSAAILGNLIWESGMDPTKQELHPRVGRGGYGIAQWTGDRRTALENTAKREGVDVSNLSFQLQYLWQELSTSYQTTVLTPLKATSDLTAATAIVLNNFEKPAVPNLSDRLPLAQKVLALYGKGVPDLTQNVSAATCSSLIGNGQDSKYIDGFLVYSQYDPAWKDLPYSTSTIGKSGCGPTAMAMIITALTGKSVIPPETANYAASQGIYVEGIGSSWNIGPVLAAHWGLKATPIGLNLAKIISTLQNGGLVIAAGQGVKPFTSGGHILVIRGVTANGKLKVGDSGHSDTSDKEWDASQLMAEMAGHEGSIYAITK